MSDSCIAPGTVAHAALQFLLEHGECSTTKLGDGIGRNFKHLSVQLAKAVNEKFLVRRDEGSSVMWRVGPNAGGNFDAEPEDSRKVLSVSAQAAPSIFAYAKQRGAAVFSVALATDGRLTIERYGRVLLELTDAERRLLILSATQGVAAHREVLA